MRLHVDREALRTKLLDTMSYADRWAVDRPHDTEVRNALRSEAFATHAVGVFRNGMFTDADNEAQSALASMLGLRHGIVELRTNANAYTFKDAERELGRVRSMLVVDYSVNLFDGAATPVTHGFLNDEYFPPWDAWLSFVEYQQPESRACLLTWVPAWASLLVEKAIEVDPAACLSWARWDGDTLIIHGWGKQW
jgi:hypothetical protein